jgi:Phytanoyl-CoA dioxygenase (PhyH)
MVTVTSAQLTAFRERGFVVIPGVLDERTLACGHRIATAMLTAEPASPDHAGPYFLWPQFAGSADGAPEHGLHRFYRGCGVDELAAQLLRPNLPPDDPDFAQLAITIPVWPHRPGGPHVDGINPPLPDGRAGTFSLLAGVWLTDHEVLNRGNLWVWPGSHLRAGAWLAEHGAEALSRLRPELSYPPVELGVPLQVTGPAGSVLLAHYLLGHNIGGHDGPAGAPIRQVIYYRLRARGHRARWREAVTDPLAEFREP